MQWNIKPMQLAQLSGLSAAFVLGEGRDGAIPDPLPVFSYLITSDDGTRKLVFDLGPPPPQEARAAGRFNVVPETHRTIDAALRNCGVATTEVEAVVLSHLHWDHMDGLEQLPNARIYVQADEMAFLASEGSQRRYYPATFPESVRDRVELLRGEHVLDPGLRIVPLPGHTPGSQGLVVRTGEGIKVCCGDLVYRYENLEEDAQGTLRPSGLCHDLTAWRRSVGFVRLLGQALPAHDERNAARLR